ncbi:biotin--[acetyl-CoA-carboxylase] ligase [Candidatus Omnitrophota bacterium]
MDKQKTKKVLISFEDFVKEITVFHFDEVSSTNDLCKEYARSGDYEILIVRADYQRKGRGRFDRVWLSPPKKNLLFSILVYPRIEAAQTPLLTAVAAQSIAEVLAKKTKGNITLKKPNDVLCNGKKIAGILTEQESIGSRSSFVILGMGININAEKAELPEEATSLRYEEDEIFNLDQTFKEVLEAFFKRYQQVMKSR